MSEAGPRFYAWCDYADTVDAFLATVSAFLVPGVPCGIHIEWLGRGDRIWQEPIPIDEVSALVHAHFNADAHAYAFPSIGLSWDTQSYALSVGCYGKEYRRRYLLEPLHASVYDRDYFFFRQVELVLGNGPRSQAVEAAYVSLQTQTDTERILLGLCEPDEMKRVPTGSCSLSSWSASVEVCSTYHSDAGEIARDLALSWVHLYDGDKMESASGLSLETLAARVEAAPKGARVGIATKVERVEEYDTRDYAATKSWATRPPRPDLARKGPREIGPSDEELTREQVLQALETSPTTLLEALEAAAVPDDEWRAAEPLALEMIEAKKQGAPTLEVNVSTGHHVRFIQQHAPYHVRRLPNGGVLLATHPYRTLWQLWADALLLLGIRTDAGGST